MATPVRLRLSRKGGFNLQAHSRAVNGLPAVNVARPGRWGNRFVVREIAGGPWEVIDTAPIPTVRMCLARTQESATVKAIALFREDIAYTQIDSVPMIVRELRGKNLACWCGDGPCHADALLEIANGPRCERVTGGEA